MMKGYILIAGSVIALGLCVWSIIKGDIKYFCYAGAIAALTTNLSQLFV